MAITRTNVLVGAATLFVAPAGTAMVPDSQAQGVDWPIPWVQPGASEEGLTFNSNVNTQDINIEEQSTPVAVLVASRAISVDIALAEDTIENMKLAYGGGIVTTQAAGPGMIGKKTLRLSDTLDRLALGFEGVAPSGLPRRVYLPTVLSVGNVQTRYRRAAAERSYACQFRYIDDPSNLVIVDQTAVAA